VKPDGALTFTIASDITESAVQDACNMMELNFTDAEHHFLISVPKQSLFFASDLCNQMTRNYVNLQMKAYLEPTYTPYEWSIKNISTGQEVWSGGA
jgi:hypothetical protein